MLPKAKSPFLFALALAVGALLAGCGQEDTKAPSAEGKHAGHDHGDHDHDHAGHDHGDDEGHHHVAPHGGTLVVLGDHFAHLELVLDPQRGALTAFVLDGEASGPIRVAAKEIALGIALPDDTSTSVTLAAKASTLTGETVGDTSQFFGSHEALKGVSQFEAQLGALEIKGQRVDGVTFRFPEGNEGEEK